MNLDHLLLDASNVIRGLIAENKALHEKIASAQRLQDAEKLAGAAARRGVIDEDDVKVYAEKLAHAELDLRTVQSLVGSGNGGFGLGGIEKQAGAAGAPEENVFMNALVELTQGR